MNSIATHNLPLVSCIMPTANRRAFVPRAIGHFLRQDYPHKELVILDDGADSVADLVPDDPRVRYVYAERKQPLGAKRNACVELARGDLIMHWDDDDWHAPRRISCQATALREAGGEICGLRQMLFHDIASGRTWLYEYPAGRPAGGGRGGCSTPAHSGAACRSRTSRLAKTPASSGAATCAAPWWSPTTRSMSR